MTRQLKIVDVGPANRSLIQCVALLHAILTFTSLSGRWRFATIMGYAELISERRDSMEAFGYKSIAFSDSGDAVIYLMDGRELTVPGHVAEALLRARAEEGLPPIPVTRATSPAPEADHSEISVPNMAIPRQWKVTICGRIEEVTDDPRFPALFEAALSSDLEADIIQFNEPSLPHTTTAVLKISEVSNQAAEAIGLAILRRNLRVAALAIIGDEPYGWAAEVKSEPLSPNSN